MCADLVMRFLMAGVLAVGAAAAGLIGQYAGIRPALWVAAIGLSVAWLPLFLSPLRAMRELPCPALPYPALPCPAE